MDEGTTSRRIRSGRAARTLAASLIAVAVGCGIAACGSSSSGAEGGGPDLSAMTWIVPQDWDAIDPTKVAATNDGAILLALEPLVLADGKGGVTPNIATQTEVNPTTFTYKLRSGVKFTDGKPLTMDDVLYSLNIHKEKGSTSNLAGNYENVKSMTATGPNELTIELKQADVQFPNTIAQSGIVEKAVRENLGKNPGAPDSPNVGTGPYTVERYQPGNQVVLARNDAYWGDKPVAKTITLRLIEDESAKLLAVRSGQATGAFEIPPSQTTVYAKTRGMKLIRGENPSITMLSFNTTKKPWDDVHVRRAVAHAVDKTGLVKAVLRGNGRVAVSVVQPHNASKVLDQAQVSTLYQQLDRYPYDLTAAKAELAQSASPNGFSDTIIYSQAEPDLGRIAQAVAQNLAPLGIKLKVKAMPDEAYTDAVFFKHTATAAVVDFGTDIPDPVSLPNYLTNSSNTLAKGGYTDISEWTSPAQDALLRQYLQLPVTDRKQRGDLLSQMLTNIAEAEPYVPIYNADYLAMVKDGITFKDFDGMWYVRRWPNLLSTR